MKSAKKNEFKNWVDNGLCDEVRNLNWSATSARWLVF